MINKFINIFKNLDKLTYKIMKKGFKFCSVICYISTFLLLYYNLQFQSPFLYELGLSLFKLSLFFFIEFIICGIVVDGIKKQII
jgi:hypothetical protein